MGEGLKLSDVNSTLRRAAPRLTCGKLVLCLCLITHAFACSGVRGGVLLDDAALLNTDTMTWSSLDVQQGDRPGPRRSHAAAGLPGRVCALLSTTMRAVSRCPQH